MKRVRKKTISNHSSVLSKNLINTVKESLEYIKSIQMHIYAIVGLFLLFTMIGGTVRIPADIFNQLIAYFEQLIRETEGFNSGQMIWFLFSNNVAASFIGFVGGIFLGIIPIINAISNGFILGFAAKLSIQENGILSLWRLLPHGIFEIPALFISLALGLRLGMSVFEKNKGSWIDTVKKCFKVFFFVVVPLLIIAAIIEGFLIVLGI